MDQQAQSGKVAPLGGMTKGFILIPLRTVLCLGYAQWHLESRGIVHLYSSSFRQTISLSLLAKMCPLA